MTPKEFRALLRRNFIPFLEKSFHTLNPKTPYKPNWHIEAVAHVLEQCRLGVETRQIICMPPRYLKSHIVSTAWPAYLLGHNPALKIFVVSYGSEFAEQLAQNFRTIVQARWYRKLFPEMKLTKTAEGLVQTSAGGERRAVSMIGAITGFGADIIIIDDPQKAHEALSQNARAAVHRAYTNTILSRLNDKQRGIVVLVAQRIHDDDLAGRLIASNNYACLQLPAIATEREQVPLGSGRAHIREIGDVLHPAREPQATLDQMKRDMGSADFQAQYQQAPIPASGDMIKAGWLSSYPTPLTRRTGDLVVQSWDTARKAGERNDYTVCTTWLQRESKLFLLDVCRRRLEYPSLVRVALEQYNNHHPDAVLIEDEGSGTVLLQDLRANHGSISAIPIRHKNKDKVLRLATVSPMFEAGRIHLPEEAPWLGEYKHELLKFPQSRHDDQVDSTSQCLSWVRDRERGRLELVFISSGVDTPSGALLGAPSPELLLDLMFHSR